MDTVVKIQYGVAHLYFSDALSGIPEGKWDAISRVADGFVAIRFEPDEGLTPADSQAADVDIRDRVEVVEVSERPNTGDWDVALSTPSGTWLCVKPKGCPGGGE